MKRSVILAGIVVLALTVAPTVAFADARPVTAVADRPADCRPAGPGAGGGSGPGDPATGGDQGGADPAAGSGGAAGGAPADPAAGDEPTGDEPGGDEPGGDEPGGDEPGGDEPGGDEPGGDKSGGGKSGGGKSAEGGSVAGDEPEQKPGGDRPDGQTSGDEPGGAEPSDDRGAAAAPADCPAPGADPAAAAPGAGTSAAEVHQWGTPNRVDEFDGDLSDWSIYDGKGHAGNGTRSPDAASVKDGILTIDGDADGKTAGMAWNPGQKYGRWEGRVRAPASDPSYNALLLLWPDAENFPVGGEVDFMEMTDHTRQETELFLHYGADNSQVQGKVEIDATQWHNWAVEWTPEKVTAFVDGKEWWSTKDTSILPPGPMHLCVQLDWFPKNGSGDVQPSKMEVDWVRQYGLPEGDPGSGDDKGGDEKGAGFEGLLDGVGRTLDRLTEGGPDPVAPGFAQRAAGDPRLTGTP